MKNSISFFLKKSTLLLLLGLNLFFAFYLFPKAHEKMAFEMGHKPFYKTLDVTFHYDKSYLTNLLEDYGAIGKSLYYEIEWQIDLIFPVIYGLFFFGLIRHLLVKTKFPQQFSLSFIPLLASTFDLIENSFILFFLKTDLSKISDCQILICTTCTKLKYIFIASSLIISLALFMTILFKIKKT